jgi:hypothetical protein
MSKSKKKKNEKSSVNKPKPKKEATDAPKDDQFDFGGLPDRDLKKNLGCG